MFKKCYGNTLIFFASELGICLIRHDPGCLLKTAKAMI
jgi:hypothetical protein